MKTYFRSATCSPEDYRSLVNAVIGRTGKARRVILAVCYVIVLVCGLALWLIGDRVYARYILGGLAVVTFFNVLTNVLSVSRTVKMNTKVEAGAELVLTEESFLCAAEDFRREVSWQGVADVIETDRGFAMKCKRPGALFVPRAGLTAMIPNEGEGAMPPEQVDVVGMFREFLTRVTGKQIVRGSGKSKNGSALAALIVAVLLIIATFVADTCGLITARINTDGYSITLPANVKYDPPEEGGTFAVWNDDLDVYNFLDAMSGVKDYFGYVPTAKEYLNEVYAVNSGEDVKNEVFYTLDNGTEVIVCSYADDDCFYVRAVTPCESGFWTTVMIGWDRDRDVREGQFLEWLGTIEVK